MSKLIVKNGVIPVPEEVKVGGMVYPVVRMPKFQKSTYMGLYNSTEGVIYLNDELSPYTERETLLHEVVHAIEDHTCVKLGEKGVHAFSKALFGLIRDNSHLLLYLMGDDETTFNHVYAQDLVSEDYVQPMFADEEGEDVPEEEKVVN